MELLRELAPGLGPSQLERRAALVVAFLEGLSLFMGGGALRRASVPGLEQELHAVLEEALEGVPTTARL